MAEVRRISELTPITVVTSGAYMPVVDPTEASVQNQNKRIQISDLDNRASNLRYITTNYFGSNTSAPKVTAGTGSPEGVVDGAIGSMYLRSDGGSTTSVYFKESGTGNTGWISNTPVRASGLPIPIVYVGPTTSDPSLRSGSGTPEGSITAPVGSVYLRTDGASTTSIYFKEAGVGNTGWVSNAAVSSGVFYSPLTYVGSNNNAPKILAGSGVPEGVISGVVGSVYLRTDGGATTSIYFKESGSLSTGWVSNSAVSSGDLFTYTVISGNKTLSNRERTTVINSGLILTLPASPSAGFEVGISVSSGIVDTVVSGAGQPIMGYAQNLTLNLQNVATTLAYVNATQGWRLF
jgi:hypothetical protein